MERGREFSAARGWSVERAGLPRAPSTLIPGRRLQATVSAQGSGQRGSHDGSAQAHESFAKKLIGTPKPGSRCCKSWGPALWGGAAAFLHVFPSPFFDPFWLRHDLRHSGERSVARYPTVSGEPGARPVLEWAWIAHAPRKSEKRS